MPAFEGDNGEPFKREWEKEHVKCQNQIDWICILSVERGIWREIFRCGGKKGELLMR